MQTRGRRVAIALCVAIGAFSGAPASRCLADTQTCVNNGIPITHRTCVSWSQGSAPVEDIHFRVNYGPPASENAPDVEFIFGDAGPAAGWRVWALEACPVNAPCPPLALGAVTVNPLTADDFDVTIAQPNGQPGATNVASISLVPAGDNFSSLTSASRISGDLNGALKVQKDLAGNGGDVQLRVETDVNGPITAATITFLEVDGSVNAAVSAEGVITWREVDEDVTANITAATNVQHVAALAAATKPGGVCILGGIIEAQVERVRRAVAETVLEIREIDADGEWRTIRAARPANLS